MARKLRDAFVNLDLDAHNALPVADALASLGRFYLNMSRATCPDVFHGLGREQDELAELEHMVLAFDALVRGQRALFVDEFGGTDGFLAWARELEQQPKLQQSDRTHGGEPNDARI
jgi:hypothetical protein